MDEESVNATGMEEEGESYPSTEEGDDSNIDDAE